MANAPYVRLPPTIGTKWSKMDDTVISHVHQRLHHLVHVVVSVIRKSLVKMRKRRADIPEMDFIDLLLGTKMADGFRLDQCPSLPPPSAHVPQQRHIPTFELSAIFSACPAVVKGRKDARHSEQSGSGRIVGMESNSDL